MAHSKYWLPSPMEQKCLRQLDRPGSWAFLKSEKPDESETISWKPVRRIFAFNLAVFAAAFAILAGLILSASGDDPAEFRQDLPVALVLVLAVSSAMALYAANLYRRTWNRRARTMRATNL